MREIGVELEFVNVPIGMEDRLRLEGTVTIIHDSGAISQAVEAAGPTPPPFIQMPKVPAPRP